MSPDLAGVSAIDLPRLLAVMSVCSVRAAIAFALLPPFASRAVPPTVVAALSIASVFPVVTAHLGSPLPFDLGGPFLMAHLAKEAAVGLMVGLGFGALFAGLQTVGEIIDHQTGLTFTQNIDHVHGNTVSLTSQFLERVLFASLLAMGVMLSVIDTLYLSYEAWPIESWGPAFDRQVPLQLVGQADRLFAFSLLLAGPVVLVLFIVDAALGLLNRATPQLSVFNLALSLKSLVGLGVLVLALPALVGRVGSASHEVAGALAQLLR